MLLAGCVNVQSNHFEPVEKEEIKVPITLDLLLPVDGVSTKAMANEPDITNLVVAVFGGSGYYNEWIPVTDFQRADKNYNASNGYVTYQARFSLTQSDSQLRLHFIANCPSSLYSNPPITGVTSQDLEDIVMSKIRSQISDSHNDGYWAKILLPYGVQIMMEKEPNTGEMIPVLVNNQYVPTEMTQYEFSRYERTGGIPFVRNFARLYLQNHTDGDWVIQKFCLAYAPAEGPIAPILSDPITTDEWGNRVAVEYAEPVEDPDHPGQFIFDEVGTVYPIDRDTLSTPPYTVRELTNTDGTDKKLEALPSSTIFTESFFINYQNYPLTTAAGENYRKLSDPPYKYGGYSPADLAMGTYPADDSGMTDWVDDGTTAHCSTVPLYLYERAKPATGQKATRIIIKAYKKNPSAADQGASTAKYYALDVTDEYNEPMAFLRNYTYTVELTGVDEKGGKDSIAEAADATSANVSSDEKTADLTEVSDGESLIAVSYIDATYIKKNQYDLMFYFEPSLNHPDNDKVEIQVGSGTGYSFQPNTTIGNGSAFSVQPKIDSLNGKAALYVKSGNNYVAATEAQIADASIKKWGKITYTTATVDRNGAAAIEANDNYLKGFSQTIRVIGNKPDHTTIFRDVLINLTPLKTMDVVCEEKFLEGGKDQTEHVRVYIPADLTRSMFPLTFYLQPADNTLNPAVGANLPVSSGTSIIPGDNSNAFYFIRTLTRDEYNELPTEGNQKYFTCEFKTIKEESGTTVYVANQYFTTDSDFFSNFVQRYFAGTTPGELGIGEHVDWTFSMDNAHAGGDMIWNDAENPDYNHDRIIPREVIITLQGISPRVADISGGVITYEDSPYLEKLSGSVYKLTIKPDPSDPDLPEWSSYTLHLIAGSEDTYSIKLSTSSLANSELYADLTVTGNITKSQIKNTGFYNVDDVAIDQVLGVAGQTVKFKFTYGGDPVDLQFRLAGLTTTDSRVSTLVDGVFKFHPADGSGANQEIVFTTTDASTVCRLYNFNVLEAESYQTPDPTEFSLSRYSYNIALPATTFVVVDKTKTVNATVTPTDAPTPTITWTSADESIATVNASGVVTGVAVGTTTVTATLVMDGQTLASATTTVNVRNAYYTVDLKPGIAQYGWSKDSPVNPNSGLYRSFQSENYYVNSSVATMSVTVVGYTEFTVYIRSNGESRNSTPDYDYTVARKIGSNALTSWTYNTAYNDSGTKAYTRRTSGTTINNYTAVTFTTADGLTDDDTPHTFYIQYGKDSGTSSYDDRGYLLIPMEYNYLYIPVSVTGVSLDRTSATVIPGRTLQLTATVTPDNADNKEVTWTSDNPSVTVSDSGLVTVDSNATGGSTATITVTTADGGKTATCLVTVARKVWKTGNYPMTYTSNDNGNASTFTDATSGVRVVFSNFERGGNGNGSRYKMMGTRTGSRPNYTYNNGQFVVSIPSSSLEGIKITRISMTYSSTNYDNRTVTVVGDVSTTAQSSAGMSNWYSTSTGDGNGDNTVTVSMEISSSTWDGGDGRNRLVGATVYYGYWDYE